LIHFHSPISVVVQIYYPRFLKKLSCVIFEYKFDFTVYSK
jgi:hypothetical protein